MQMAEWQNALITKLGKRDIEGQKLAENNFKLKV